MNKTISIIRIAILFVLGTLAIIFFFGEEQDEAIMPLLLHMAVDKSLAFAMFYSIGTLYKRWCKVDPIIMACDKMCNEVMEGEDE